LTDKPRKPWLAGLLTFLTPGLGHLYAGAAQRGIILYLIQGAFLVIFLPLFLLTHSLIVLVISICCGFVYFLYCLFDAIKIAKGNKFSYQLKEYNKWYVYIACWFAASIIIQPIVKISIKKNIVQAYKIPSGAMLPTMLPGDHILADKFTYKNNEPQRGDVIIFPYPVNPSQDYIKRVIGLEGDVIEFRDKQMYINNKKYDESYIVHRDPRIIPRGVQNRDNYGPITIPENSLFVLGDNRDNSYDSRFWGFVDKRDAKGKAIKCYWSWDKETHEVRWDRIGQEVK
jgi:signal peptidase I